VRGGDELRVVEEEGSCAAHDDPAWSSTKKHIRDMGDRTSVKYIFILSDSS
jgi:hypothetical protein